MKYISRGFPTVVENKGGGGGRSSKFDGEDGEGGSSQYMGGASRGLKRCWKIPSKNVHLVVKLPAASLQIY